MYFFYFGLWLAVAFVPPLAFAAPRAVMTDRVVAVEAGQVLHLADHGRTVFADLAFPDAAAADAWLAEHVLQRTIAINASEEDRYGRTQIESDHAEAMLREGVALVMATRAPPTSWLAAEAEARHAKRGIWSMPDFILTPQTVAQHLHQFRVAEGTITRVYTGKSAVYLNFGEDWETDFSITIAGRSKRSFADKLPKLTAGTRVRVRGMIYEENGPMIRVMRPEQLEIL